MEHATEITFNLPEHSSRIRLLRNIGTTLSKSKINRKDLYKHWHRAVHGATSAPRPDLLWVLYSLASTLSALQEANSSESLRASVECVAEMWP